MLALGESHAQQSAEPVASSTQRFTRELLPLLAGRARHLIVELWLARGDCGTVEAEVAERQRPVTAPQAASNQAEFLALGTRAKELGITPHALTPTCGDYRAIVRAGPGDIDRMLELLAETTLRDMTKLLDATDAERPSPLLVAYGGALHNDSNPRPGREHWSFGPELRERLSDRYVELDLFVPEFVKDTDTWRALPWYPAFHSTAGVPGARLFSTSAGAFVLIFPRAPSRPEPTR